MKLVLRPCTEAMLPDAKSDRDTTTMTRHESLVKNIDEDDSGFMMRHPVIRSIRSCKTLSAESLALSYSRGLRFAEFLEVPFAFPT
jgi:hypothetical protein